MKTIKEFKIEKDDGFGRFWCYYGNEELGFIEYYKKWKKFVWNQSEDIIMSESCLLEVIKSIKKLKVRIREVVGTIYNDKNKT